MHGREYSISRGGWVGGGGWLGQPDTYDTVYERSNPVQISRQPLPHLYIYVCINTYEQYNNK